MTTITSDNVARHLRRASFVELTAIVETYIVDMVKPADYKNYAVSLEIEHLIGEHGWTLKEYAIEVDRTPKCWVSKLTPFYYTLVRRHVL